MGFERYYINPFRLVDVDNPVDYNNKFPFVDSMLTGVEYQRGILPSNYTGDWVIGKEMSFILIFTNFEVVNTVPLFTWIDENGIEQQELMTLTTIYFSYPPENNVIAKISYTPTKAVTGKIKLSFVEFLPGTNFNYESDNIKINSEPNDLKELLEIRYYDTKNRYGGYFFDGTSQVWSPRTYYTGFLKSIGADVEQSVFKDDNGAGGTTVTQSVIENTLTYQINDIDFSFFKTITAQLQCDNVYINGVRVSVTEIEQSEINNKTQLINITIKAVQKDDGFQMQ